MSKQSILSRRAVIVGVAAISGLAIWAYQQYSRSRSSSYYSNPVVYQDFADCDVFIGPDGAFYYSASNMHYSPGAPILKSHDLVNWEIIGHSIPCLSWSPKYDMANGETAYVKGTWASTMRYRKSNGLWYWMGCIELNKTYVYTAPQVSGPWVLSSTIDKSYYDCSLFIDDDDTMYVVYGQREIYLAQLSDGGLQEVKSQLIFKMPYEMDYFEGSRMYKRMGKYYVICDHPLDYEFVFKADSPWGSYDKYKLLVDNITSPIPGGTTPNQGSLVELPNGEWEFISFTSVYPLGRVPVIARVQWDEEDFPILVKSIQPHYPLSNVKTKKTYDWMGDTTFTDVVLSPDWEWNHNPDKSKYTVGNGLVLYTATVTSDIFHARNTLTHRINGEFPVGTIELDFENMADGDHSGLAAFRHKTSRIEVTRIGGAYFLQVMSDATQDPSNNWKTLSRGKRSKALHLGPRTQKRVWLRLSLDTRPTGDVNGQASYSFDGVRFSDLGKPFKLDKDWRYFMGYRFAIFNYAEKSLGGSVRVVSFTQRS
jgi:beta-xylosidase